MRCVSWILRNITDLGALDAAIRLAGTIRRFDGPDVDVPYDSIVSTFEACFDPSRVVPWIKGSKLLRSVKKNTGLASPIQDTKHQVLILTSDIFPTSINVHCGDIGKSQSCLPLAQNTHPHTHNGPGICRCITFGSISLTLESAQIGFPDLHKTRTISLNAILNCLLIWCTLLDSPPMKELLMVQNKSYGTSCFVLKNTHRTLR